MSRLLITFGLLAAVLFAVVAELVRRRRLKERHAGIWMALGAGVVVAVFFPSAVIWVSDFLGFELPANLVLVTGLVVLTFVAIQLSVEIGRLRDLVERLTTEIALISMDRATGGAAAEDDADRTNPTSGDDDEPR